MRLFGALFLAALAAGCYESSSGREDGAVDPAPDQVPDSVDSLPEPIIDTALDDEPEVYPDCQASAGVTVSFDIDPSRPDFDREATCTIASFWFNDE